MLTEYDKKNNKNTEGKSLISKYLLVAPDDKEFDNVSEKSKIDKALLLTALDQNALTRIHFNHITSVFIDLPHSISTSNDKKLKTTPVGFFYTDKNFVAVSKYNIPLISKMMNDDKTDAEHGDIILLEILYEVAVLYIKFLNQINDDTERLETRMKRKVNNDEIFQLMDYQRSLTAINTSLKGLKRLLTHIKGNDKFFESRDLMEDTVVAIEQASEMADIFNSDLDALMDAFGSVLSNNVNQIMKILTSLTLIIAIPTMVAGIYGMNVKLPFAEQSWAFTLIVVISIITSVVTGIVFYRKNML